MTDDGQLRRVASAVTLAVLLVLAGCTGGGGGGATSTGGGQGGASSGDGQRAHSFYRNGERVVVRSATMEIRVETFEKQFRKARAVARKYGGFVTDYSIESRGDWKRATFTVRVPAGNFSAARDGLANLGKLESERVRARDFTGKHRQREGTLARLRERERNLERRLRNSSGAERERIRDELRTVRDRIDELRTKQRALERRAALSTIEVTMHEPVGQKPPENYRSSFGFGDSLLAGLYGGLAVLKGAVVLLGYLVSLGLSLLLVGSVGMVFVAGGLAVGQRLWPLLRRLFGVEHSPQADAADESRPSDR